MRVPPDARIEVKFVAFETELRTLMHWLQLHRAGFYAPFPSRRVNSVYFDTHDFAAFRENLSGSSVRTKVRYRWYGESDAPGPGSLEIKRKRNYFGWKLHFRQDAAPHVEGDDWATVRARLRRNLRPEGRIWLDASPQPVMICRYRRRYFVSADDRVRATIDTDQGIWDQRFKPRPNFVHQANLPPTLVVELKFDRRDRVLATELVHGLPIRVSRNSKYISAVRAIQG